jgi:hypothetical protein
VRPTSEALETERNWSKAPKGEGDDMFLRFWLHVNNGDVHLLLTLHLMYALDFPKSVRTVRKTFWSKILLHVHDFGD